MSGILGLPDGGLLRVSQIVNIPAKGKKAARAGLIPVSRATWYAGVKTGRYPAPTKVLGPHITAWSVVSIRALIESANGPVGDQ